MKRVRFIKQRDLYSCGAIAAMNALKWAGRHVTYRKHFRKIKLLCKTDKDGTFIKNIYRGLRHLGIKARYEDGDDDLTSRDLLIHLWNGGSIVLGLDWKTPDDKRYFPHVVFICFDGTNIIATNMPGDQTAIVVPPKVLNKRSKWGGYRFAMDEAILLSKQEFRP